MTTTKETLLNVVKGEMVEQIPFTPRLDLWHNANVMAGTLPEEHKGKTADQISRDMGWALHKMVPEYMKPEKKEDILHRGIGLYRLKEFVYDFEFSSDVEVEINHEHEGEEYMTHVVYHTPKGSVHVRHGYTEEMLKSGASITWVKEHAITKPEDYKVLAHIFGNLKLTPRYDAFTKWKNDIADDGVAVGQSFAIACSSPTHFIQKSFLDATSFYLHYNDHKKEMDELIESLELFYERGLKIIAESPAEAILWAGNVDDMVTYPEYYKKEILPWCQKAAEVLKSKGKFVVSHPDGENKGLMDLIPASGFDVAEAITPAPMTKVSLADYYDQWCRPGKLTIWGGIPESMLLEKSATNEDFEAYLNTLFKVIQPGTRFIAGIGDTTPPGAVFDRLKRIDERLKKEGRLPLEGGAFNPVLAQKQDGIDQADALEQEQPAGGNISRVTDLVLKGDRDVLLVEAEKMLEQGVSANDILNDMLEAMEIISPRFTDGTVFIPEVLLSARALNDTLEILEPHLGSERKESAGKVLIGTVKGDLHDIGKNMVSTMLKGVGFEIRDLGINITPEKFLEEIYNWHPDVLALSALLTTTMPQMDAVIKALEESGLRDKVKVVVGGAPVNQTFADQIGADGYSGDAGGAVALIKRLVASNGS
jgi:methylmalonyl-CoA mutase cobalamin-binding domain/chain